MIKDKYSRQRYEERKASKLCVLCGKPLDREGVVCTACNSKRTAYGRELYKKLQAVGVCPRCGKNLLYGDEKSCVECRAKSAETMSKIRATDVEKYNEQQTETKEKAQRAGFYMDKIRKSYAEKQQ
jgi:predicted amidophosphoribosyltransferase